MSWMDFIVQLVKPTATPVVILVALYWFKKEVAGLFKAIDYFIKRRSFKATVPGATVETTGSEAEEVRSVQQQIEAAPNPPGASSVVHEVIDARRFILRDPDGNARAEIGFLYDQEIQQPAIRLFDAKGATVVSLFLNKSIGPTFLLRSVDGHTFAVIAPEGRTPFVSLSRPNGDTRTLLDGDSIALAGGKAFLGEIGDLTSSLILQDKNGRTTFSAP